MDFKRLDPTTTGYPRGDMRVGIIGLGEMGGGFAARLLAAHQPVVGWNRTPGKARLLVERGLVLAGSPRGVAEASDVVLTMVTDVRALAAVTDGPDGVLAGIAGKVLCEMSTIAPATVQALAAAVAERGGTLLDAPVLGSQVTLAQGKLMIMVGGDEATLARVRPVLERIGPKVVRVGDVGHGKTMKLALNLSLPTQILALSEGLLLAVKAGIPRDAALEVMLGGASASPMMQYRGPLITAQPDKAWFDCTMMQKDVTLALELGRALGVPLPTTDATNVWLTAAHGQGLAHHDFSILYYVLARAAGLPLEIPKAP
jgi:3-hydroxyisobutyrate dehydrogenase-like beta-hydroxyacid dehydrogenase